MKDTVERLNSWLRVNRLKINLGTTNFVIFSHSSAFYPWIKDIVTHNGTLKRVCSYKYLGVYIDEVSSFKRHVQYVCKIVSRKLGIIRKLKHFFLLLLCAFFIFSLSIFIYCIVVVFGLEHFLLLFGQ
jgi:hypothetical protein